MPTPWNNLPKRSSSGAGRNYNVSGLLYDTAGVLYQGAFDSTTWTFITRTP